MRDLFTNHLTLGNLAPDDTRIGGRSFGKHCLASAGREYVVELSPVAAGATVSVNVNSLPPGGSLSATWYDLDLGGSTAASPLTANGTVSFTKPFAGVGILVLD